jgi:dephospho-CoA kinase
MARIIGLTGGIGSGKSAATDLLAAHGAVIVDADVVAREVVAPGAPAHAALVERFGSEILDASGAIDRQRLADLAFATPESVAALNEITHPAIGISMYEQIERAAADDDAVVVVAVPLLTELHRTSLNLDTVIVVDCPTERCVERLIEFRSFPESDARARIAAQISREERLEMADHVLDNGGDLSDLGRQIGQLWPLLEARSS